jgi:DNA (cytosine-5)-methyltransferase 1
MVRSTQTVKVVDLFCGIGGLTKGLKNEGFEVVAGIDNDLTPQYGYEASNGARFIGKDIMDVSVDEIRDLFVGADIKVLVGCAPCQPYSGLNRKGPNELKMTPLRKFGEYIAAIRPEIVSMENVRGLTYEHKYPVFTEFLEILSENGYEYEYKVIDASEYGVPQKRNRLVLLASRLGKISLIPPTHLNSKVTVRDVIGNLAPIRDGEDNPNDKLHRAVKMNPLNKQRIVATPHDGGDSKSWDDSLLPECYKRPSGTSYRSTVYGRMRWDEPAPTMTTNCVGFGNGRFGHPEQDRAISLREAAIIQTFPQDYVFCDPAKPVQMSVVAKFIGNAVPVALGQVIGKSIRAHLAIAS